MIINWTTIHVSDMQKSLDFYNGLLGLPVQQRMGGPGHDIAMLGPGEGTRLELICTGQPMPAEPGQGVSMGFTPGNLNDLLEKLDAAGVVIPAPMSPNPALRFYFVKDPDGYSVQLVENLL